MSKTKIDLDDFIVSYWTLETLPEYAKSEYINGYLTGILHTLIALDKLDILNDGRFTMHQKAASSSIQSEEVSPVL